MRTRAYILLLVSGCAAAVLTIGCDSILSKKRIVAADDILLASVEDRQMYLSDIVDMVHATSPRDSINQVNALVESWLKRNVVLNEAESNFPKTINIDQLVDDYRSSLLLHNYRQELINKDLDTVVTAEQLQTYYDTYGDQYPLRQRIVRARLAQVPADAPRIEKFYRNWKNGDSSAIVQYLSEHATLQVYDEKSWYTEDEFLSMLPDQLFSSPDLKKVGNLQKHWDTSEYFIKVLEVVEPNNVAPIDYIKESMQKVIIHQRKAKLLDNIEARLYELYLQTNRIKVNDTDS